MKVKELIRKLKKMPQDAEVVTEGCDCVGDTAEVVMYRDWHSDSNSTDVIITRSDK